MLDRPLGLAAMLRRSQQLPVDVAVSVRTHTELCITNSVLRLHANRLRRLELNLLDQSVAMISPSARLLEFAVPQLRELELRRISWSVSEQFVIPPDIFNGNAPELRSLALYGVGVPESCPALANVATAFVQGACPGMKGILDSLVSLERLELVNILGQPRYALPEIGAHTNLADVRIHDSRPNFALLERLGYTQLTRLHINSADGIAAIAAAAAHLAPTSESTLVIGQSGATELLVAHADGRTASFIAENLFFREIRKSFDSDAFRDTTRLVLPLHFSTTDYDPARRRACPLFPWELQLPRLLSLAIRCTPCSAMGCGLLDPAIVRGTIAAPSLARLEVTAGALARGTDFRIRTAELALFVEKHLKLAQCAQLEVFIDTANGVQLESVDDGEELARLRRSIGKLVL